MVQRARRVFRRQDGSTIGVDSGLYFGDRVLAKSAKCVISLISIDPLDSLREV